MGFRRKNPIQHQKSTTKKAVQTRTCDNLALFIKCRWDWRYTSSYSRIGITEFAKANALTKGMIKL